MGWLRRRGKVGGCRDAGGAGPPSEQVEARMAHLEDFVATRAGVEIYVEPRTTVTADDGRAGRHHGGVDPAAGRRRAGRGRAGQASSAIPVVRRRSSPATRRGCGSGTPARAAEQTA